MTTALLVACAVVVLAVHWLAIYRWRYRARRWEAVARDWKRIAESRNEPTP